MTGQIPPYGKDFALEHLEWTPDTWDCRRYALKRDRRYFIRSLVGSHKWFIMFEDLPRVAVQMGKPTRTYGEAMARLLSGIEQGLYQVSGAPADQIAPYPEHASLIPPAHVRREARRAEIQMAEDAVLARRESSACDR